MFKATKPLFHYLKLCYENQHWTEDKISKEMIIIIVIEQVLRQAHPYWPLIYKCSEKDKRIIGKLEKAVAEMGKSPSISSLAKLKTKSSTITISPCDFDIN